MERIKHLTDFRFTRFVFVGVVNTLINFAILNLAFYLLGQGKLVSSFIATSCALVISFLLNRAFVFADKEKLARKFLKFLAVTAAGTLIVQNSVYFIGISTLGTMSRQIANTATNAGLLDISPDFVTINLSNTVASLVVMLWNYNGYRILVFNDTRHGNEVTEDAGSEAA